MNSVLKFAAAVVFACVKDAAGVKLSADNFRTVVHTVPYLVVDSELSADRYEEYLLDRLEQLRECKAEKQARHDRKVQRQRERQRGRRMADNVARGLHRHGDDGMSDEFSEDEDEGERHSRKMEELSQKEDRLTASVKCLKFRSGMLEDVQGFWKSKLDAFLALREQRAGSLSKAICFMEQRAE